MRTHRPRTSLTLAALAATLALLLAVPPASAGSLPSYRAFVTPSSAFAGSSTSYTATITNDSTQTIGSANINAPSRFTITSITSFSSGPPATAELVSGRIRLRNMTLGLGESATVTFDVAISCTAAPGTWSIVARKSPTFAAGTTDPTLDAGSSQLAAGVDGDCHLAFGAAPADAQVNTNITSQAYTPDGPSVTVLVLDGGGSIISSSAAPVTLEIVAPPSGGLSGGGPVTASDGVATFGSLQIDTPGLDFRIVATTTTPGIRDSSEAVIDIPNFGVTCPETGSCESPPITEGDTTAQLSVEEGAMTASMALDVESLNCARYREVSAVVSFDSTGGGLKTITLQIPKSVGIAPARRQVCYASPAGFVDRDGVERGPNEPALLPMCEPASSPCVVSKSGDAETITIVFVAPAGDPRGRT